MVDSEEQEINALMRELKKTRPKLGPEYIIPLIYKKLDGKEDSRMKILSKQESDKIIRNNMCPDDIIIEIEKELKDAKSKLKYAHRTIMELHNIITELQEIAEKVDHYTDGPFTFCQCPDCEEQRKYYENLYTNWEKDADEYWEKALEESK